MDEVRFIRCVELDTLFLSHDAGWFVFMNERLACSSMTNGYRLPDSALLESHGLIPEDVLACWGDLAIRPYFEGTLPVERSYLRRSNWLNLRQTYGELSQPEYILGWT